MSEEFKTSTPLRMSAYFYSFDQTGTRFIDMILCAVASAGKAYHHTESWCEEAGVYPGLRGSCPVEWIQNAANDGSAQARSLIEAMKRIDEEYTLWMVARATTDPDIEREAARKLSSAIFSARAALIAMEEPPAISTQKDHAHD